MKKFLLGLALAALLVGCESPHSHQPASGTAPEQPSPTPKPSPAGSPGAA